MAYKLPINLKELNRQGILDERRFFRLLSEQNNYVDPKTVEDFYMGLVRMLTKELKDNGVVRLPHMGDMALVKQKDRLGLAGKYQKIIKGSYVLRFYPKEKWRDYFHKLEDRPGLEGRLDPREKVLNKDIDDLIGLA